MMIHTRPEYAHLILSAVVFDLFDTSAHLCLFLRFEDQWVVIF